MVYPILTNEYYQIFSISASAENGGTISPEGVMEVKKGEGQVYVIAAKEGYRIKDVIVDDTSVGAVSEYQFSEVSEDHMIKGIFEKTEQPAPTPTPPTPNSDPSPKPASSPNTGDSANIMFWAVLLLSAAGGMGILYIKKFKNYVKE